MNRYADGHYSIEIAGHAIDDLEYHGCHIAALMRSLFHKNPSLRIRHDQQTLCTRVNSKRILGVLKSYGMPLGKKTALAIPEWIMCDIAYRRAFLRGLFDTDGSVIVRTRGQHSISLGLADEHLIRQVRGILEAEGFFVAYHAYERRDPRGFTSVTYSIRINRKALFKKFFQIIGSSHPKKVEKVKKVAR